MLITDTSKLITMQTLTISKKESQRVYVPDNFLASCRKTFTRANGKYYIWKYDDLFNEFIGSYLSSFLALPHAKYCAGTYNGYVYVLSEVFFEEGFTYFDASDFEGILPWKNIEFSILFNDKLSLLSDDLLLKMLKLIAVDLRMGQTDRHIENIIFKKDINTGVVDLAPVFDFSNSYSRTRQFRFYQNPFVYLPVLKMTLGKFVQKYPQILEYIKILDAINVDQIMQEIENTWGISFDTEERDFYFSKDEENKRRLRRL